MRILFVDPGLQVTGLCIADTSKKVWDISQALDRVEWTSQLGTISSNPIGRRLARLGSGMRDVIVKWGPSLVYVEVPVWIGSKPERQRAMQALLMATGAIIAACHPVPVVPRKASRYKKEKRHQQLEDGAVMSSIELPLGPRKGSRKDTWDSIWIAQDVLVSGDWRRDARAINLGR